jgi:hypothetical protein
VQGKEIFKITSKSSVGVKIFKIKSKSSVGMKIFKDWMGRKIRTKTPWTKKMRKRQKKAQKKGNKQEQ